MLCRRKNLILLFCFILVYNDYRRHEVAGRIGAGHAHVASGDYILGRGGLAV